MSALLFADLRAANVTRHRRYYAGGLEPWRHDDWLIAIGGEVGEALNVAKKLNRDRLRMEGNGGVSRTEMITMLGDELADVVIYLDILASTFLRTTALGETVGWGAPNFDRLRRVTCETFAYNDGLRLDTLSSLGRDLFRRVGWLMDAVPTNDRELALLCDSVLSGADGMALAAGIDLGNAVVRKFNATSEKLGFPERLVAA